VRDGVLYTTPLANSVLCGITRTSVLTIAKALGIPVVELPLPREMVYICDEAFSAATAAEVTHLRSVDKILVGDGTMGPVTTAIHDEFFAIVNGIKPDRYGWLTPVRSLWQRRWKLKEISTETRSPHSLLTVMKNLGEQNGRHKTI